MDTEVVRTFLRIVEEGSFVRTAERLNVAQTTVSARVRLLEDELGRRLFVRGRSGTSLTPAGQRFLRHAAAFVQMWEHARHQVAIPPGHQAVAAVGAELSLWNPWLRDWLVWMRENAPEIAIRADVDTPDQLMERVSEGSLDVAVMHAPQQRTGLAVELLFEEHLVLVTAGCADGSDDWREVATGSGYVAVDWGAEFAKALGGQLPGAEASGLTIGHGPLALSYVLNSGGAAYLRLRAVKPHLADGTLRLVAGAPRFPHPAYVVRAAFMEQGALARLVDGLRITANQS